MPSLLAKEALGPTITVGEILVEIMATQIGAGFREAQPLVGPFASGAPAIFIDQVARFGGAAGIIASVGDDDFGALNVERLRADGADVSAISVDPDRPTGSAFVRYRDDGARDFVFNIAHSAAGIIQMSPPARQLIARAGHVHVMGSAFSIPGVAEILGEAIDQIKKRGGSVSFDPNIRKELVRQGDGRKLFEDLLSVTDLLLPSGDELLVAADEPNEEKAIEKLLARGVSEIVLKRGKDGSSHYSREHGQIDCPAFAIDEIDPTGAGDCFGAVYLTSRRMGHSPDTALLYANAGGALAVSKRGPMEGAARKHEIEQFITAAGREIAA